MRARLDVLGVGAAGGRSLSGCSGGVSLLAAFGLPLLAGSLLDDDDDDDDDDCVVEEEEGVGARDPPGPVLLVPPPARPELIENELNMLSLSTFLRKRRPSVIVLVIGFFMRPRQKS